MIFRKKQKEQKGEEKKVVNVCPVCHKPYDWALTVSIIGGKQTCRHDAPAGPSKIVRQRHANADATAVAQRMAAEARVRDSAEGDIMVPVRSTQEGKDKGKTLLIPKRAVDSIEAKITADPEIKEVFEGGE